MLLQKNTKKTLNSNFLKSINTKSKVNRAYKHVTCSKSNKKKIPECFITFFFFVDETSSLDRFQSINQLYLNLKLVSINYINLSISILGLLAIQLFQPINQSTSQSQ